MPVPRLRKLVRVCSDDSKFILFDKVFVWTEEIVGKIDFILSYKG